MLRKIIGYLSFDSWKVIDEEWKVGEKKDEHNSSNTPIIVGLLVVTISLIIQEYVGDRYLFMKTFPERLEGNYGLLETYAWWSGWRFFGYVVIPVVAMWFTPKIRARDCFISFKKFFRHLPIYAGLFAVVLPFVLIAAKTPSFSLTYPFYKLANRSAFDFWAWEGLYILQFLSLEFFFRGYLLRSLAPRFGSLSIFVMVVPYCMIHFGKPMAETFGAIFAGVVLGTIALRTRSIWGGVIIHVCVALLMDYLAVGQCPPPELGTCLGH